MILDEEYELVAENWRGEIVFIGCFCVDGWLFNPTDERWYRCSCLGVEDEK